LNPFQFLGRTLLREVLQGTVSVLLRCVIIIQTKKYTSAFAMPVLHVLVQ